MAELDFASVRACQTSHLARPSHTEEKDFRKTDADSLCGRKVNQKFLGKRLRDGNFNTFLLRGVIVKN